MDNPPRKNESPARRGIWQAVVVCVLGAAVAILGFVGYFDDAGFCGGPPETRALIIGAVVLFSEALLVVAYRMCKKNSRLACADSAMREKQAVFQRLIDALPMGIAVSQTDSAVVNKRFRDITGIQDGDSPQMCVAGLISDKQPPLLAREGEPGGGLDSVSATKKIRRPDGQYAWVDICMVSARREPGTEQNHLCIIDDVTQRILTETALRESERSKAVILAHLPGMAYRCRFDRQWTMLFVSEGCERLTGYLPEDMLYNHTVSYNDLIAPEYREVLWREWERTLALNKPFHGEYEIISKDGARRWVMEMGQGIYDTDGAVVALEGLIIDMTAKKMGEAQIRHMSNHDFLTGLYNRKFFEEEKLRIQRTDMVPVSIIMANINGVRLINDAFGHTEGDRVIIEAASLLKRRCREGDVLARTGGDEFSLLLPGTDAEQAGEILQSIFRACEQSNNLSPNRRYDISLSLGFGTKVRQDESIGKAAKDAEESMHNRKLLNRKSSHSSILSSIMATMFERSQETEEHAVRLSELSKSIGEQLGLPHKKLVELELFSMLHDIGKVGIDDRILNKADKLNNEEWAVMKKHPEIGYRIAMSSPELEPVAEYILSHHERWDGTGYPQGLKGEDIPLLSRILAVADAYDAMTEDRVYRKAMTRQEALDEIRKNAGTQFDPLIAQKFIEIMT